LITVMARKPTRGGVGRLGRIVRGLRTATAWEVWALVAVLWAIALLGFRWLTGLPSTTHFEIELTWWHLAIGFYFAEVFVVHLQFRKDAHTLSMSEVPMLLGLIFANPMALLAGQMAGSAVALVAHRRQRPVKLTFNLGHLAIQTVVAVAVFRSINGPVTGIDGTTVLAAAVAMIAALFVGHVAILAAIRASGGHESLGETGRVFAVSSMGTVGASGLAIVAAMVATTTPQLWWIGFAPVVFVFIAYRAYVAQSQEKARVAALFEAATALHRNPQIDRAVVAVAERVLDLVQSEAALVAVDSREDEIPYLTVVDANGIQQLMAARPGLAPELRALKRHIRAVVLESEDLAYLATVLGPGYDVRGGVAEILTVGGHPVGVLAGINRVGDVSAFDDTDARVLATLGSQLSTSLENGRLSESLSEIRLLKEQLEGLLASKDRLIASVSHELRTPLTGVIGLTSLIRETSGARLDEDSLNMLDLVVEQGTELSNIIEDLLTHARAQAGSLEIEPVEFNLTQEALTVAASQGLEPPDSTPVWAIGDSLRTRQILRNLVTNARRYGGPSIRLAIGSTPETAYVSLIDDGPGVPEDAVDSIFEPYHSAHETAVEPGSVGLGLAVSRSMAKMMAGDLTYDRQDGHTRFTLSIPAASRTSDVLIHAEVV
jgi:signal transduction histidine kinase